MNIEMNIEINIEMNRMKLFMQPHLKRSPRLGKCGGVGSSEAGRMMIIISSFKNGC